MTKQPWNPVRDVFRSFLRCSLIYPWANFAHIYGYETQALYLRATTGVTVFAKVANQPAAPRQDGPTGRRCYMDTRKQQWAIRANPWGRQANENRWICPNKWGESLLWIRGSRGSREEGSTLPLSVFPLKCHSVDFIQLEKKKTQQQNYISKTCHYGNTVLYCSSIKCEPFTGP